jgi:hypothetical protein
VGSSKAERLTTAEPLDLSKLSSFDRQQAIEYLEKAIDSVDLSVDEGVVKHRLLSRAVMRLKQNLNFKLVIDGLILNWAEEFGKE